MKITSSKDKNKVIRWAKKNNRSWLWQDRKGYWHAATTENHVVKGEGPHEQIPAVLGEELPYPPANHVGKQLAWFRENTGLTQAELAKRMTKSNKK